STFVYHIGENYQAKWLTADIAELLNHFYQSFFSASDGNTADGSVGESSMRRGPFDPIQRREMDRLMTKEKIFFFFNLSMEATVCEKKFLFFYLLVVRKEISDVSCTLKIHWEAINGKSYEQDFDIEKLEAG
ncbi:hypothetical protein CEXT_807011, partial [Caerostris extrusa]